MIDQLAASAGSCEAALEALEVLARVCWADEDARQVAASDAGGWASYNALLLRGCAGAAPVLHEHLFQGHCIIWQPGTALHCTHGEQANS